MAESADFDDAGAIAVSIGSTSLVGTGLAKESGGNLDTHTSLLSGATAGALIGGAGRTVGQEVAALIASGSAAGVAGGTPVLHGYNQVYSVSNQVIAASGSFTPTNIVFTKPSYIIRVTAQMSGTNAAVPSVKINAQWRFNSTGTVTFDQQLWYIPAGGSSQQASHIRGPALGDRLNITFSNGDATDSVTLNINILEGSFPASRHDGRSVSNVGMLGATGFNDDPGTLIIANDSFTVPGSSTVIKTMALYSGQVDIWLNQNTGGGSQVSIVPTGDYTSGVNNPIASLDWTAPPHQQISVNLPRAWCTAQFTNNAVGPVIATIGITAVEFAS